MAASSIVCSFLVATDGAGNITQWQFTLREFPYTTGNPQQSIGLEVLIAVGGNEVDVHSNDLDGGGVAANCIARWDGTSWSALGSGLSGSWAVVFALITLPNGDVVAGGDFTTADGVSANRIARSP